MHAVILAGGRGVRLRPYTTALPKPLVPIGDEFAIMDIVLRQLRSQGFESATIAIGHLGQLIRAYCGDGSQWGLSIDYWTEDEPLGTMGPVVSHLDEVPDEFVVMNGDVLTDLDYRAVLRGHAAAGAPLTVAVYDRTVKIDFGVLEVGGEDGDRIVAFREKPIEYFSVSMGVYAYRPDVLKYIEPGQYLDFPDLVLRLIAKGERVNVFRNNAMWLDIGRPDDYALAQELVEKEPARFGLEAV